MDRILFTLHALGALFSARLGFVLRFLGLNRIPAAGVLVVLAIAIAARARGRGLQRAILIAAEFVGALALLVVLIRVARLVIERLQSQ